MSRLLLGSKFPGAATRGEWQSQRSFKVKPVPTSSRLRRAIPSRPCWLDATGRVQALLEIRMDATGADVLVLAGAVDAVSQGFDRVIFPRRPRPPQGDPTTTQTRAPGSRPANGAGQRVLD